MLLSQLCKYDGVRTRTLKVREFQQIAGRAGRKGFDDVGDVWAQAPAHVVENIKAEEKAANDPKKKKKLVKKKPPERGYTHWSEETFTKLVEGDPESLDSSFDVSHHMLMNVLDRPGDGCGAMKQILLTNHEPRRRQRSHIKRAISIYRSLLAADVVETLDEPDDQGRTVRVTIDLQDDFALTQPLSLFAVEAIDALEKDAPDYELNVLSVVEAVIESPGVIMAAQLNQLRGELVTELKSAGVEYDERMEKLDALEAPKPLADFLYPAFDIFRQHHPWVGQDNVRPKSIARELWERAMTFSEYIQHYGLKRSEGVLLRYLSDAYKGLVQNVPEDAKTDELYDLTDWLGEVVRQVDSSLLDEWERLTNPTDDPQAPVVPECRDVTQTHAFRTMVRNEAFRWIQLLARSRTSTLAEVSALSSEEIADQWAGYFDEHEEVISGPDARGPQHFVYDVATGEVTQTIVDPDQFLEWKARGKVDFEASRSQGHAVVEFTGVAPIPQT